MGSMTPDERGFVKAFFRQVTDKPLDPDDPRYVDLYSDRDLAPADPVELLTRSIEWTPGESESVQLLSGFRGTGKSTELRRLRRRLQQNGYLVVLCDIEDYLNLSTRVDVSDFLMAVAGAFGDALVEAKLLDKDPAQEGYWTRLVNFLTRTKVQLSEVSAEADVKAASVSVKANLKSDPSFREQLQQRMAGHLGALVADVRAYLEECVIKLRERHPKAETVLLLDSVEHIRGTSVNAAPVQSSVETLFASHADKLHLPNLHVVYTVPPYLKVRYPGLGALYSPGGLQVLPALKVREGGEAFRAGLDAAERLVRGRGDWLKLLGERAVLDRLVLQSGGHLRDLLRILAEILRRAYSLPASGRTVESAIQQIKTEFLPLADADAIWLARIAQTKRASLEDAARLPDLARFLDTHLVLCYRNDSEWYDVHPLILEEVKVQAREALERRAAQPPAGAPAAVGS